MDLHDGWSDVYEEIFGSEVLNEDAGLMHFGKAHDENPPGRGSGRYAFGSGDKPFQRDNSLLARVAKLKAANPNLPEAEIAKQLGYYKTDYRGNILYFDPTGKRYMKKEDGGEPVGSTGALRAAYTKAYNYDRKMKVQQAQDLEAARDPETGKKLYSRREIADIMGLANESSVRSLLDPSKGNKFKDVTDAEEKLKQYANEGKFVSLGPNASRVLGISETSFDTVKALLREDGYLIDKVFVRQGGTTPGQGTSFLVLCPPGSKYGDGKKNLDLCRELDQIESSPRDVFQTLADKAGVNPFKAVDLSRIDIRYAEQDGKLRDGAVEIRAIRNEDGTLSPACPDLSLGNAKYGQVRIAVSEDGKDKYYIKGMAYYNPDLPEGTDILVNSNKSIDKGVEGSLKPLKTDKRTGELTDMPFGSMVWQTHYIDSDGNPQQSCINFVGANEKDAHREGAWADWGRTVPSQMLMHQDIGIIKQQLNLTVAEQKAKFDEINSLENNVVRKQLLLDFGEACDAKAVDLKAHAFSGQSTNVLIPVPEIKDNEVYAPNYAPGQLLALVRYPNTGPWEVPLVKNVAYTSKGEKYGGAVKNSLDAIGVNPGVLAVLSGADCDGDTATVIPITDSKGNKIQGNAIRTKDDDALYISVAKELKGFDPNVYETTDESKWMNEAYKGKNMGVVANIARDMHLLGCTDPEKIVRIVKYNMITIDAPKHNLDWKQAAKDLDIDSLKNEYQISTDPEYPNRHGASTLLSRAKSVERVPARSMRRDKIDPETGEYILEPLPDSKLYKPEYDKVKLLAPEGYKWIDKEGKAHNSKYVKDENGNVVYKTDANGNLVYEPTGKIRTRMETTTKMAEAKDASELLSANPTQVEYAYRDFANEMKALGNQARKEAISIPSTPKDPKAEKEYAAEVASLEEKLNRAKANSMRERQAQILYNQICSVRLDPSLDLSKEEIRKIKGNAIKTAREATGAQKERVRFTDKEWEAVQKHAIAEGKVRDLLQNSDQEHYMSLAMPKTSGISNATANYIQQLLNAGYSKNQIAENYHYSIDTINKVARRTDLDTIDY